MGEKRQPAGALRSIMYESDQQKHSSCTYCAVVKGSLTRKVSPFSWHAGQTTVLVARRSSRMDVTFAMMNCLPFGMLLGKAGCQ
jgi:hypothetical protein